MIAGIRYKSEHERLTACRSREQCKSAVAKRLEHIIECHQGMTDTDQGQRRNVPVPCRHIHANLVADVLQYVITDILHNQAEQDWLFGVEMKESDK